MPPKTGRKPEHEIKNQAKQSRPPQTVNIYSSYLGVVGFFLAWLLLWGFFGVFFVGRDLHCFALDGFGFFGDFVWLVFLEGVCLGFFSRSVV